MKNKNLGYLDGHSPVDSDVRFFGADDNSDEMLMEIACAPSGTVSLRMSIGNAKRLAVRLYSFARGLAGELPDQQPLQ